MSRRFAPSPPIPEPPLASAATRSRLATADPRTAWSTFATVAGLPGRSRQERARDIDDAARLLLGNERIDDTDKERLRAGLGGQVSIEELVRRAQAVSRGRTAPQVVSWARLQGAMGSQSADQVVRMLADYASQCPTRHTTAT